MSVKLLFISLFYLCLPFNSWAQNPDSNTNAFLIADDALERSNALVEASNLKLSVTLREHLSKKKLSPNPEKITEEQMKTYTEFNRRCRINRFRFC